MCAMFLCFGQCQSLHQFLSIDWGLSVAPYSSSCQWIGGGGGGSVSVPTPVLVNRLGGVQCQSLHQFLSIDGGGGGGSVSPNTSFCQWMVWGDCFLLANKP